MYVDFAFYAEEYGGDKIPEDGFRAAASKAETYIRALTYPNGDIFAKEDGRVKLAVCAAAEAVFQSGKQNSPGTAGIKSETNDGYSIAYVTEAQDGQTAEEILQRKAAAAVRPYLLPTGWLSRRTRTGGCCDACADCGHYI